MPLRPVDRARPTAEVLGATLEDLVPADHPVRFVAAFVEGLDAAAWGDLGIAPAGPRLGAPAFAPAVLLAAWIYGFMTGVRSCRKLEAACREQVPLLWLTGGQGPDHNTLWRFYERHRDGMRALFKRTVATAVATGLVDWAVQAVDGTKVRGNAASDRTLGAADLARLLERTEAAIADLEARNRPGDEPPPPPPLPPALRGARALRERIAAAQAQLAAPAAPPRVNVTDPEAVLVRGRQGVVAGYNAQAAALRLRRPGARRAPAGAGGAAGRQGPTLRLIAAADVAAAADDHGQLAAMLDQAAATTGRRPDLALVDGGYHDGATLAACADRGQRVAMPEAQGAKVADPYHKDAFVYDAAADAFTCPGDRPLTFRGEKARADGRLLRIYKAGANVCRACPAFGVCTTDARAGRALEVGPHEERLRAHRAWMATAEAQAAYRQRKHLIEPVFGVLKEEQDGRRFLLRGLGQVRAEWALLAAAFNLRTLARLWRDGGRALPAA